MKGLNGGVMTVKGTAFEIRAASGNILKGTLKLDASNKPARFQTSEKTEESIVVLQRQKQ